MLLHISDLHITDEKSDNNERVESRLQKIYAAAKKFSGPVDIIITGDIVNSGLKSEYKVASALLDQEKAPDNVRLYVLPGNHDFEVFGILGGAFNQFLRALGFSRILTKWPWMLPPYAHNLRENITLYALDSNNDSFLATGKIPAVTLQWLKAKLSGNVKRTRVVALHHHPYAGDGATKLVNANELLDTLQAGCEAVLFGHEHKEMCGYGTLKLAGMYISAVANFGKKADDMTTVHMYVTSAADSAYWLECRLGKVFIL